MRLGKTQIAAAFVATVAVAWAFSGSASALAQEKNRDPEAIAFFESKIRPALVKYCYECHSEESGKSKGGLLVDSREALLRGGDTDAAVVPGDLEASLFVTAIRYQDEGFEMPPKGKLPDSVIADFEKWIGMGAPDPRIPTAPVTVQTEIDVEAGRDFWAYRPPVKSEPPVVRGSWARSDIDRFVQQSLEQQKLVPAKEADAAALIRRLYFVLGGLPPSPEAAEKWRARIDGEDGLDQQEIVALVDNLLASDRYGESWGRHWLDVARFAESTGGDSNSIYPHAWRYRNYVIDAFNEDKPFDEMILEQIAGDLLPISSDAEWARNLVATGFLAVGVKLVGEEDDRKFFAEMIDEQVDTTTRAFLATTVACARCHDHKTDPIPQADYYALADIFRNTTTHFGLIKAQSRQFSPLLDVSGLGLEEQRAPSRRDPELLARLRAERDEASRNMQQVMAKIRSGIHVNRSTLRRSRTARDRTEAAVQAYDEDGNARTFIMGTQDRDDSLETRLLVRGELDKPGQIVAPGFVQVISDRGRDWLPMDQKGSGRLELARWIASAENPLTARVMANRIWHYLYGQGLVRTVDDFGVTGEAPSHPQLLDYLALRLVENDWSIKAMIREIVLTRSWQMSSDVHEANFARDPDNRYLWRMNKRRLSAEAIRDAMMVAGGTLEIGRPSGSLLAVVGEGAVGKAVFEPEIRAILPPLRSVYLPRVRSVLPEALELFDAPDASLVTGTRETTTVPLQALYLMNGAFVREQAVAFAERVASQPYGAQLDYAHRIAYGRAQTREERDFASYFASVFHRAGQDAQGNDARHELLAAYCHALLCTAEFSCID
jgi:cytochrome c553